MVEETDAVMLILRQIQSDLAQVKGDIAVMKDKMIQHSLQLSSQGGSLGEIARILQYLPDWARQPPTDISRELLALKQRMSALESQRQ